MKAIGVYQYRSADDPACFAEIDMDPPPLSANDLLVQVKAVSVNPVDYKVRASVTQEQSTPRVLGWDAAGIVERVGSAVSLFKPGDAVYYAGSIVRPGSDSEYHVVDERIVGKKPASLSFEEAAALPLTTITAWEGLFERLGIEPNKTATNEKLKLLIIGGTGGVGLIAIQLAKDILILHS